MSPSVLQARLHAVLPAEVRCAGSTHDGASEETGAAATSYGSCGKSRRKRVREEVLTEEVDIGHQSALGVEEDHMSSLTVNCLMAAVSALMSDVE
jgi:hypothetical protein